MSNGILRSQSGCPARLFELDERPASPWCDEELGDILRHQLRAPLLFDLGRESDGWAREAGRTSAAPLNNFGDLLRHPSPPLELLRLTKEFAKTIDQRPDSLVPSPVATTLYYAAIIVALLRHGQWITDLDADALRLGVNWVLKLVWLDPDVRALFEQWMAQSWNRGPGETKARHV